MTIGGKKSPQFDRNGQLKCLAIRERFRIRSIRLFATSVQVDIKGVSSVPFTTIKVSPPLISFIHERMLIKMQLNHN